MSRFIIRRLLGASPVHSAGVVYGFRSDQAAARRLTVSNYAANLSASGETVSEATLLQMRRDFGLDAPFLVQYWHWIWGVLHGNFGYSFKWQQPVGTLIWERLGLTLILSISALFFTWAVALPIGVLTAVRLLRWRITSSPSSPSWGFRCRGFCSAWC